MPALIIIALLAGGTVTLAAEGSLPGDTLYPVKTHVTENILSAFAVTNSAEASLESKLAARRLEEAETLAAMGNLDDETRASLEANFETHARNVEARIQKLEGRNDFSAAVDIGSKFEASLRAHKRVIENAKVGTSTRARLDMLSNTVLLEIQFTEDGRAQSEAKAKVDTAIERDARRLSARLEKHLEFAERFTDRMKDELSPETYSDVSAQLQSASVLIIDGNARIETGAYSEAYTVLQSAHRIIEESRHLIEIQVRIESRGSRPTRSTDEADDGNEGDSHGTSTGSGSRRGGSTGNEFDDADENRESQPGEDKRDGRKASTDRDRTSEVEIEVRSTVEADHKRRISDDREERVDLESQTDSDIDVGLSL